MNIYFRLLTNHFFYSILLAVLALVTVPSNVFAKEGSDLKKISHNWEKASDKELDLSRGGFALGNGMMVAFSFEKKIFQNGIEYFSSFLDIPDNIPLVQNGANNYATDFTSNVLNSIVQNNLDNQFIKTINTINIRISNVNNINYNMNGVETFRSKVLPFYK